LRPTNFDSAANYPNTANRNPKGVVMTTQCAATCGLAKELASIINSQFLEGFVTSSAPSTLPAGMPIPTPANVKDQVFGTGIETMAKWVTNGGGGRGHGISVSARQAPSTAEEPQRRACAVSRVASHAS
jgi:hypothetical protein